MKTIKDLLGTPESIRLDGRKKEFREKLKKLAYEKAKKEAEAPIDEISAKLAGRYIKKRTHRDIPYAGQQMGSQHKQRRHQGVKDFVKHTKSVDMAVDKLTKNKDKIKVPATEANVNEISKGKVADYIKKRSLDTMPDAGYRMNDPHSSERRRKGTRDYVKCVKNIPTAVNKLTGKAMVPATEATAKVDRAAEDKTTDAERAAIDAFMKKKGAKQLPPGKAQGHHGKSFSIKPMGISPKKMGVSSPSRLDKDMVHKEDKAYGPTGIAYSVPKGHPDAVDPKTGKKKYSHPEPPHVQAMRAAPKTGKKKYSHPEPPHVQAMRDKKLPKKSQAHPDPPHVQAMRDKKLPKKSQAHPDPPHIQAMRDKKEDTVASVAKDLEKVTKKDKKESFKSFMKSGKE